MFVDDFDRIIIRTTGLVQQGVNLRRIKCHNHLTAINFWCLDFLEVHCRQVIEITQQITFMLILFFKNILRKCSISNIMSHLLLFSMVLSYMEIAHMYLLKVHATICGSYLYIINILYIFHIARIRFAYAAWVLVHYYTMRVSLKLFVVGLMRKVFSQD